MANVFLLFLDPFCGITDTPDLDFWWRVPWISKPRCFIGFGNGFLRFTSDTTPTDLLVDSMTDKLLHPHTCIQALVGLNSRIKCAAKRRGKCYISCGECYIFWGQCCIFDSGIALDHMNRNQKLFKRNKCHQKYTCNICNRKCNLTLRLKHKSWISSYSGVQHRFCDLEHSHLPINPCCLKCKAAKLIQ